ncbi:hypothetical protein F511_35797 [Dorcoceras hygrometricum]|uniref:Uncharacterized protein n=1 Tax=Dorcoceras hygrometricum TaxID=472368 RepID=A0A2Z7CKF7_9LAMI|nr:hypothetical protein F511_35797 [Dorcoceras hygrometricum]
MDKGRKVQQYQKTFNGYNFVFNGLISASGDKKSGAQAEMSSGKRESKAYKTKEELKKREVLCECKNRRTHNTSSGKTLVKPARTGALPNEWVFACETRTFCCSDIDRIKPAVSRCAWSSRRHCLSVESSCVKMSGVAWKHLFGCYISRGGSALLRFSLWQSACARHNSEVKVRMLSFLTAVDGTWIMCFAVYDNFCCYYCACVIISAVAFAYTHTFLLSSVLSAVPCCSICEYRDATPEDDRVSQVSLLVVALTQREVPQEVMSPRRRGRGRGQIPEESKGQTEGDQRSFPSRGRDRQAEDEVDELAARVNDMELVMAMFQRMNPQVFNGDESSAERVLVAACHGFV